ncbi:MAG: hypothetical protein ACLFVO_25805 [Chloroflexaceae bacterium]
MTGSPGFSRWNACRERLIRLKPGLLSGETGMQQATFIRRWNACRERLIRLMNF